MANISFYHLHTSPLEKALPKLLEKVWAGKVRALVRAESDAKAEELTNVLWTYSTLTFIPHGNKNDGFVEKQPIYLTAANENPNGATLLLVTDGEEIDFGSSFTENFTRFIDMFDGTNEEELAKARKRWSSYKKAGHTLTYWKQTAKGGWEEGGG